MPESTGSALTGLAGHVEMGVVARSLDYLRGEVNALRTPVSLGWGLLGLAAWVCGHRTVSCSSNVAWPIKLVMVSTIRHPSVSCFWEPWLASLIAR